MSCRDHGIALRQTFQNFHFARLTQADLDHNALGYERVRRVPGHDLDHKSPTTLRHDGLFRHHQSLVAGAKHRIHPGKHAGAQLLLAVVYATAHSHGTAIGIDQGIDCLHHGSERAARQSVNDKLGFLTRTDLGLKTLGQAKSTKTASMSSMLTMSVPSLR